MDEKKPCEAHGNLINDNQRLPLYVMPSKRTFFKRPQHN
jgi:hypothetical protein